MRRERKFQKKVRDIQGLHRKSLNRWWQGFIGYWRFVDVWKDERSFLYLCDQDTGICFGSPRLMKKKIQRTDLGFLYTSDEVRG